MDEYKEVWWKEDGEGRREGGREGGRMDDDYEGCHS